MVTSFSNFISRLFLFCHKKDLYLHNVQNKIKITFSFPVTELSDQSVDAIVNKLYDEAISSSIDGTKFAIQLQLKINGTFRSISKVKVVTKNGKEELKSVWQDAINQLYSHYGDMGISNVHNFSGFDSIFLITFLALQLRCRTPKLLWAVSP